jgi:hypothetical protein
MTRFFRLSPSFFLIAMHAMTVIIGAISVGYYLHLFPPSFRGWPEITPDNSVAGWAVNEAAPMTSVEVQLYIDNQFIADRVADMSRPDVVALGRAKYDRCGFNFNLPPLEKGEHEAQVYVMHEVGAGGDYRTLQRLGNPLRFKVP